jgi:hypothetical protein
VAAEGADVTRRFPAGPPRWMDALLVRLVDARDRDTIPGDLLEEYRDTLLRGETRLRATAHYIRQVLSVAVVVLRPKTSATAALGGLSTASLAGMAWFGFVTPNPTVATAAALFIAQSIVTIVVIATGGRWTGFVLVPGAIAVALGGALSLVETLAWTAFEWKAALAGLSLLTQGLLTMALSAGYLGGFASKPHLP